MENRYYIVNKRIYGTSSDGYNQYFDMITSNVLPTSRTLFLISQDNFNGTASIYTSTDGNIWTERLAEINTSSTFAKMVHSDTLKMINVVVGGAYSTSVDGGITWVKQTTPFVFNSIAWSPTLKIYVAVGQNNIATSTNGLTWTIRNAALYNWRDIEWNSTVGRFLTVSSNAARIAHSTNGTSWTQYTSTSSINLDGSSIGWRVRVYQGNFIIVATNYYTSPTGFAGSWTPSYTTPFGGTGGYGTISDITYRGQYITTPAYYLGTLSNTSTNQNIWYANVGSSTVTKASTSIAYYGALYAPMSGGDGVYICGHQSLLRRESNLSFSTITVPNKTYLHLYRIN